MILMHVLMLQPWKLNKSVKGVFFLIFQRSSVIAFKYLKIFPLITLKGSNIAHDSLFDIIDNMW